jgi:phosphoribosyl-AMP cyclohydrolase
VNNAAVVELADRRSEDLEVALYWARRSGRLWVKVTNRQSGHTARIDATAANALDVFRHPYAYERVAA